MIGFAAERLMELEVGGMTGAAHGERSPDRLVQRDGYRQRDWETRAGTAELRIPKLRRGRDVATDEPLWEFFAGQPNEWQTWPEWIETTLMHAVLCGDGMTMLRDPFTQATSGNVRFLFRRRMGGAVVLAETMRKLKCAAA
jgi:hypothetical protein